MNLANEGAPVNTSESETRPSLSWDGETLYFGRAPAAGGPGDVYWTGREKTTGSPAGAADSRGEPSHRDDVPRATHWVARV